MFSKLLSRSTGHSIWALKNNISPTVCILSPKTYPPLQSVILHSEPLRLSSSLPCLSPHTPTQLQSLQIVSPVKLTSSIVLKSNAFSPSALFIIFTQASLISLSRLLLCPSSSFTCLQPCSWKFLLFPNSRVIFVKCKEDHPTTYV